MNPQQPVARETVVQKTTYEQPTGQPGHFNQITQRWETDQERPEIPANQAASTMPDSDGTTASAPSFTQQVNGFAKRFAGKLTGKEHEVAMGDALLEGKDTDQARQTAEVVKDQEESTK